MQALSGGRLGSRTAAVADAHGRGRLIVTCVATPSKAPTSRLAKRSKVEIIKEKSDYLRHPLMEELVNEHSYISEDAVQLMKFHGSYQQDHREKRSFGSGKAYMFMMRTRQPSGLVPNRLYLVMDELADQVGRRLAGALLRGSRRPGRRRGCEPRPQPPHAAPTAPMLRVGAGRGAFPCSWPPGARWLQTWLQQRPRPPASIACAQQHPLHPPRTCIATRAVDLELLRACQGSLPG
jgi:hypothetical protein